MKPVLLAFASGVCFAFGLEILFLRLLSRTERDLLGE